MQLRSETIRAFASCPATTTQVDPSKAFWLDASHQHMR
jgi:hypothetical protein